MDFRGGIFGSRRHNHLDPYLNSTIILFDNNFDQLNLINSFVSSPACFDTPTWKFIISILQYTLIEQSIHSNRTINNALIKQINLLQYSNMD